MKRRILAIISIVAVAAVMASAAPAHARRHGEQQRCFKTYCHWQKKRPCYHRHHCGVEKVCSTALVICGR